MKTDAISILASILIALLPLLLKKLGAEDEVRNEIYFVVLSACVIYIFIGQLLRRGQVKELTRRLDELKSLAEERIRHDGENNMLAAKQAHLARQSEIVQLTGNYALDEALQECDFGPSSKSIVIKGRGLAYRSYSQFWRHLADYQKLNPTKHMLVRVTHSSDMQVWKDRRAEDIYSSQKDFSAVGSVFRIFISRCRRGENMAEYIHAMKRLRHIRVNCAFLSIHHIAEQDPGMEAWIGDFCNVEGLYIAAEWGIRPDFRVDSLTLNQDRREYDRHLREWDNLVQVLDTADYEEDARNADEKKFLMIQRDEFLKNLAAVQDVVIKGYN